MMRHLSWSWAVFAFSSLTLLSASAYAVPAKFGLAPDNSQELLLDTIASAKKKIHLNVYQFESQDIADAIIGKIQDGLEVTLLIEGQPFPQVSSEGKKILAQINSAIVEAKKSRRRSKSTLLMMMKSSSSAKRRYRYDHAKYILVDDREVLISSENFADTGHPAAGTVGNRGWETVVTDPQLASDLESIFEEDIDPSHGDIVEYSTRLFGDTTDDNGDSPDPALSIDKKTKKRKIEPIQIGEGDVAGTTLITSPDSLASLEKVIRLARERLLVEYMSLPSQWKGSSGGKSTEMSPLVRELIESAKRGAAVRVLLNDDTVFHEGSDGSDNPNLVTAKLLRDAGICNKLQLDAKIVSVKDVEITYIHNKGFVVDRTHALVSSINGTKNSITNNRETALLLESGDAADYFASAFDFDWDHSPELAARGLSSDSVDLPFGCANSDNSILMPFLSP